MQWNLMLYCWANVTECKSSTDGKLISKWAVGKYNKMSIKQFYYDPCPITYDPCPKSSRLLSFTVGNHFNHRGFVCE